MTEKEILLSSILNCSRGALYGQDWSLNDEQAKRLSEVLSLRSQGFPLQYILGEVEFFGLAFRVDNRVLIPRPETEILVEAVINLVTTSPRHHVNSHIKILDIGTGSGCIAVCLAKFLPQAAITAIDISFDALSLAKENALRNSADKNISFIQSDLLSAVRYSLSAYDLIVSNPPYIASADLAALQKEVRCEPALALDGGKDGLYFYYKIITEAPKFLNENGLLLLEMGFAQCAKIKNILQKSNNFEIINVVKDYSGIERVITAKLIPERKQAEDG